MFLAVASSEHGARRSLAEDCPLSRALSLTEIISVSRGRGG